MDKTNKQQNMQLILMSQNNLLKIRVTGILMWKWHDNTLNISIVEHP